MPAIFDEATDAREAIPDQDALVASGRERDLKAKRGRFQDFFQESLRFRFLTHFLQGEKFGVVLL